NIMAIGAMSWGALAVKAAGPPVFPFPAVRRTVASGQTTYLRHRVVGALPLSYQWTFNGTNLPGATSAVLVLTNVLPDKTGFYSLVASNSLGVLTNSDMEVAMAPILLTSHPTNQVAFVGADVTLRATALGQSPRYQWSHNGTQIPWGTNSSLTITNVQLSDAGAYSVSVSNTFGGLISSNALLTVWPILVTHFPQDQVIFRGGSFICTLAALASSPLSYQWRYNGADLAGATQSTLTLTNVFYDQAGTYEIIATTAHAAATNRATLSVVPVAAWGTTSFSLTRTPANLTNLVALAASGAHNLALKDDGTVVAWGQDRVRTNVPAGLTNVVAISAGDWGSLALKADRTIAAWGFNTRGQTNVPPELTNVVAISAGAYHNLALKPDGTVVAWGQNSAGETNVPPGLTNVVAIDAGDEISLALTTGGRVIAWGYNGAGRTNVPADLVDVVAVAAGTVHCIALKSDGSVVLWGWTDSYGLENIPATATNIVAVQAGYGHCLALRDDGTVIAWGYHFYGETNIPTGLRHVTAIASGEGHNLALVGDTPSPPPIPTANPSFNSHAFTVTALTMSGSVYRLEHKDNISDTNWVAHPLVTGTGGTVTFTDATANGTQRFYRVRRW
ncbi:MAG TPA: immunoglobulin domain-containing protein, partial [Clostridia bacterium]|nr:immunoglobulin domain-containing protein [Clostridia bacterium]